VSMVNVTVTANEWLRRHELKEAIAEAVQKDTGDHAIVVDNGYGCLSVTARATTTYDLTVSISRAREYARHTANTPRRVG
jgi:hypothetical protein